MKTRTTTEPKNASDPADTWRAILLVSDLFRIVSARSAESEKFNRITVNQARIYGYLFKHRTDRDPIRLKTLAHDLDVTPAAAGQAVDRLVRAGMVSRTPDPDDRRAVRLSFSRKALAAIRGYERQAEALLAELAGRFPPDDFAAFRRVLVDVLAELESRWAAILAARDAAPAKSPLHSVPVRV